MSEIKRAYFSESLILWLRTSDTQRLEKIKSNIRLLRLLTGLTQKKVAVMTAFDTKMVADFENGKRVCPDDYAEKLYDVVMHQPMKTSEQLRATMSFMQHYIWSWKNPSAEERLRVLDDIQDYISKDVTNFVTYNQFIREMDRLARTYFVEFFEGKK